MSTKRRRPPIPAREEKAPTPLPHLDPATVAAQQGVPPLDHPEALHADFWPEHETAEEFVQAVRQWRRQGRKRERKE